MKKIIIVIITMFFLFTMNGCSKNENIKPDMFYGETEKWVVIATADNLFKFMYKGEVKDLKTDTSSEISFAYGTSLGTVVETQPVNNKSYYEQKYTADFLSELNISNKNTFGGDKFINVKISYANVTDEVDLTAYNLCVTKK